ncbi:carbohydrate ABC transporter substrate-binding protein (CUT1 family) [Aliiruegeria haliotis]|uniref:Carbohydrate ABC transporter substrate-binding protein (CUT1 family) n=1 Tax=Aliiruegeria haliotis TaxID=1280846 RepID=A0A2T0RY45_9RHOB|nr:extracellular solute-binding protein [Aliiruegeria haliotis]PRY26088.1 carbohydrate ABC transporter substrate-binding protein (CUT1 family) [Aliiruegeria haliotis]
MKLKTLALAGAMSLMSSVAFAECAFENTVPLKSLSAGFEAWKAVTDAMAECGNFEASLDQEFREKQPEAFAANPSLYHIGGVANSTIIPLLNAGSIRPLDDLVEKYGANLTPNQLIKIDGKIMAIAMMVNTQHLMYREDILNDLGIAVPTTYAEVLDAAAKIKEAGVVEYPIGGTFKTGWNLGEEFINNFLGEGGEFFTDGNMPNINNEKGVASLEVMKALTEYMDPEYLVSDSTYVQQQFQQGKIAMSNLWASRAAAMDDEAESQVVGKVVMAAAPMGSAAPATSLWWDGLVFATNMTDEEADAAFRVAMEGIDEEMVKANNDAAVWLVPGYAPGRLAVGAAATAAAGARPYPGSGPMGIMHTVLGNGISDYLTGAKDAATTLADIEAAYVTAAKEAGLVK